MKKIKKLFLASYASMTIDLFIPFLPKAPNKLALAFIPTARDPYHIDSIIDPEKEKLKALGFTITVVDIKNKTKEQVQNALIGIDVIFVAGGNTFYLLEKARESGFDLIIRELVENGVVYIGSSAGSVIAGPDIAIANELDDSTQAGSLTTTKGFGLVNFIILPHYNEGAFKEKTAQIYKKWKDSSNKVIPLTDNQAIFVENSTYKILES